MTRRRIGFKNLQDKIIVQMLIVSLLPILVIGVLVYFSMSGAEESVSSSVEESRNALQEDTIATSMAAQAWNLSLDLETWIAERINEIKSWTANQAVVEAARNGQDDGSAQGFLLEKVGPDPYFGDTFIINLTGTKVLQANPWGEVSAELDEKVWKTALSEGLYVSDIYLATKGGIFSYYLDVAVLIDDRTTLDQLGVLVGTVVIHPLYFATEYGAKVPNSRMMILSRQNKVVSDTEDPERYLNEDPEWSEIEGLMIAEIANSPDKKKIEPDYVITEDIVAGFARATNKDVTIQFPNFEGLGWTVMVEQSAEQALAPLNSLEELETDLNDNTDDMLMTLAFILAAVAGFALVGALYMGRSITGPIMKLYHGVQEVMKGNLGHKVGSESTDEIGQLSRAFDDMTANVRKHQEELEAYSVNLEKMVENRTQELQAEVVERKKAQEQLKEQTAMMIHSEKMSSMGTLVAGVAHELNNPMTGIINYAQYCLKHTEKDDRKYTVLQDIEKEARRCANIIWNMVTFARMDAEGEEDFKKESIAKLVDRVITLLNHRIVLENVTIITDFDDKIPDILVQATGFEQMLLNLLGNALDAMEGDKKTKEIRIEVHTIGNFIEITIADTGKGIAPEVLRKIFDPFFTTKAVGKGTGLGLSICQSICKQHGGKLDCESKLGTGTKFTIRIPIERKNNKEGDS